MTAVIVNSTHSDDVRRSRLYAGDIYLYQASTTTRALCDYAKEYCERAFAPYHPQEAQDHLSVTEYVEILKGLKPGFIHDPITKTLMQALLAEYGCDPEETYFDIPRLRTACHGDYLSSGLAYAFKPHRDTWYSPPMCQLNWWLPVYPTESDNCMAFHPAYWDRPVLNSSEEFDYQDWNNNGRKAAANQVGKDTRRQSEALEPLELEPDLRVVPEEGGMFIFSAAHLHSSVPNTSSSTRISLDFRTVHVGDLRNRVGAPNLDSACSGTTVGDYLRASDLSHLPQEVQEDYLSNPNSVRTTMTSCS
ncbi:hypothetical protein [Rubinisphaera margarita]|uniref:hypothetical protein n=1 Tax=Rubinisphaera margarita TaxID=2909586 RepID=UPI001EE8C73E|nr:hypothetical protein [Rubinisphaera margarita]MCG6155281.1 hypothetical protein [Rubinisphaera margarita]